MLCPRPPPSGAKWKADVNDIGGALWAELLICYRDDLEMSSKSCSCTITSWNMMSLVDRLPTHRPKDRCSICIRYGLVVRIPGSHPGGPGSIPGVGNPFLTAENLLLGYHGCSKPVKNGRFWLPAKTLSKSVDEDGIRTHACRAHWISSPTP